jgi:hypothetical protein
VLPVAVLVGEYLHVAIDDRSRVAFTQVLPSERKEDTTAFLNSSLAWFASLGITVERVMTDNGLNRAGYPGGWLAWFYAANGMASSWA